MRSRTVNDNLESLPLVARFQLLTGLRISEALALNCEDFLSMERSIMVRGKGGKTRLVAINHEAQVLITLLKGDRKEGALFISQKGTRLSRVGAWYEVKSWCEGQGMSSKGVSTHSFRKGFATALLKKGVNARVIQKLLGHSSLATTQRYLEATDQDCIDAVALIG